jgi:hypothetical protein
LEVILRIIVIFLMVMMPWICCIAAELPIKTPASQRSATSKKYKDLDNIFSLYEPYLANIGPYKPVYFLTIPMTPIRISINTGAISNWN